MKGETWMHTETPHNPDPSIEERCAFYKWALDQLEAGVPELERLLKPLGSTLSQIDRTSEPLGCGTIHLIHCEFFCARRPPNIRRAFLSSETKKGHSCGY